jgi:predicted DNA-binding protein
MPFSLRLDEDTERRIRRLAQATGRTKSQVVREAVAAYGEEYEKHQAETPTAYDTLKHLIGTVDTGGRQLSDRTGQRFREVLEAKARGRRSR